MVWWVCRRGCWRCVKVKLINLVFISWHCLFLPRSHAPIERHRRANKLLPRHSTPGERWVLIKRPSQGLSQVSLQCLPTAPPDLYRELSLLIKCVRPVAPLEPCFVGWGDRVVGHASSYCPHTRSSTCMCTRMVKPKVRLTLLVFQKVQQQRYVKSNTKAADTLIYCFIFFQTV